MSDNRLTPPADNSLAPSESHSLLRLKGRRAVIASAAAAIGTQVAQYFNFGIRILEKLDLADFTGTTFLQWLRWLFSPSGAQTLFVLFLAAFFIAVIRTVQPKEEKELTQPELQTALIESEVAKAKEALNAQHQSEIKTLRGEIESLQFKLSERADRIEGHKRAFDDLKRKYDGLQARLNDWEKYTWLVGVALKQADAIHQYVTLERIERADARLHDADGIPYISFHFYIINKSVFDITVELDTNARDSYIVFSRSGLREPLHLRSERFFGVPNAELYLPNLGTGCLTIKQQLSPMEAHTIARGEGQDDAIFHFDRLVINIKGHNREPRVEGKRLMIDKRITLNNELLPVSS